MVIKGNRCITHVILEKLRIFTSKKSENRADAEGWIRRLEKTGRSSETKWLTPRRQWTLKRTPRRYGSKGALEMAEGCCFTGHRDIPERLSGCLREKLREYIACLHEERKIGTFYVGGCVGFDTLAAQETLEYRAAHPDVRLVIVVPYHKQSAGWSNDERKEYERIKASATEVVCLAEHYFRGCTHQRNRYMVQRSSVCVCYLTKERGGTASTVKYALRNGLFVCNLAVEI